MWFAFAGLFYLFAFVGTTDPVTGQRVPSTGQVYVDDVSRYRWYVIVFAVLGRCSCSPAGSSGTAAPADHGDGHGPGR